MIFICAKVSMSPKNSGVRIMTLFNFPLKHDLFKGIIFFLVNQNFSSSESYFDALDVG